jgi:hypothetical protein
MLVGRSVRNARSVPREGRPDVPDLVDLQLAGEIQLLGEVIAAAGAHPWRLTVMELDVALGISDIPRDIRDAGSPAGQNSSSLAAGYSHPTEGAGYFEPAGLAPDSPDLTRHR